MSGQPRRGWRDRHDRGLAADEAATCADEAAALTAARVGPGEHLINVLYGLREPIVVILIIIAFMAAISGKPLDGLLTLIAGVSLAWDTGRRSRARGSAGRAHEDVAQQAQEDQAPGGQAGPAAAQAAGAAGTARLRRPLLIVAGLACGAAYALVVGSFTRYSWPATVPVIALGVVAVMIGWRGPRRIRPLSGPLPVAGTALWGGVFVAGCLWELTSLLQQPNLETGSYSHPTISTLTDPLLSTTAGRAVVLAVWLGFGWFLVER